MDLSAKEHNIYVFHYTPILLAIHFLHVIFLELFLYSFTDLSCYLVCVARLISKKQNLHMEFIIYSSVNIVKIVS